MLDNELNETGETDDLAAAERLREGANRILAECSKVIVGQKDVLESLVNRAAALKLVGKYRGMEALIKGGFYGPWNRGERARMMQRGISPERIAQVQAMLAEVAAGRNVLRGMTDQGSAGEIKGYAEKIRGEYYGWGVGGAREHQTAAAKAQAALEHRETIGKVLLVP